MRQRTLIIIAMAAIGVVGLVTFAVRDAAAEIKYTSWGALKVKYLEKADDPTGGGGTPTNTPPPPTNTKPPKE